MTSYKGRKKPSTGRDGSPLAGSRSGSPFIPTTGRSMHGSSGLSGRVLEPNNPLVALHGPLGQGFGNITPLGSNGISTNSNITVRDGLGRGLANLGGAVASSQGGNFMDFLTGLVGNGKVTAEVAALIIQAATQYGMAVDQRSYDAQLTQDQRQYDWNLLLDQRLYNTPTNELARLMGAGISRDAAIQILNSSGSSGGAGAGSPVVSGVPSVQGMDTPGTQELNIANTAISAFTNLVNMGFGVAQSYQQYQYLKNQNVLSQGQAAAYTATGDLYGLMSSLGAGEDAYKSLKSASDFVEKAAQNGNMEAAQFIASGKLNTLRRHPNLVSRNLQQLNRSENDADLFLSESRRAAAEALVSEKTVAKLGTEIKQAEAEIIQIQNNAEFIKQQTATSNKMAEVYVQQAEYLKKQGKVSDAEALLNHAQKLKTESETVGIDLQNEQTDAWMHTQYAGESGLEWLTTKTLNELSRDARVAEKTSSPAFVDATFFSMYNSAQKIRYVSALDVLASQTGLEFAEKYPELYHQWTVLHQCGAYDFLNAIANGNYTYDASTGVTMFGVDFGFKTTQTNNSTVDYLDGLQW